MAGNLTERRKKVLRQAEDQGKFTRQRRKRDMTSGGRLQGIRRTSSRKTWGPGRRGSTGCSMTWTQGKIMLLSRGYRKRRRKKIRQEGERSSTKSLIDF